MITLFLLVKYAVILHPWIHINVFQNFIQIQWILSKCHTLCLVLGSTLGTPLGEEKSINSMKNKTEREKIIIREFVIHYNVSHKTEVLNLYEKLSNYPINYPILLLFGAWVCLAFMVLGMEPMASSMLGRQLALSHSCCPIV